MTPPILFSTEKKSVSERASPNARAVLNVPIPAGHAARLLHRVPAGRGAAGTAQERRPAGGHSPRFSRSRAIPKNARLEFVSFTLGEPPFDVKECQQRGLTFASPLRAKVRLTIMDKEAIQAHDQGSEGAGSLHGRDPAHDHHRLVRHQRHRARHRFPVAPLARACSSSTTAARRTALGQTAVLGAHHSLPRLLAGLRVRPEGLPVFPRRPPAQDAGDHSCSRRSA